MPRARDFLASFSRITTTGRFIPEIDGLRFVAVTLVMLFHLNVYLRLKSPEAYDVPAGASFLQDFAARGNYGVELFFVLSGFILSLPFAGSALKGTRPPSLPQYFLRRLTRLEPPYVLCMLGFYLMHVTMRGQSATDLFPHLVASLLYSHNIAYAEHSRINVVAWSLEIEVQFYVLAPFLAAVFALRSTALRRTVLALVLAASTVFSWTVARHHPVLSLTILNYLQYFLAGFLLSDVFLVDWKEAPGRSRAWDALGVLAWAALPFFLMSPTALGLFFAPYILFLYCTVFRGNSVRSVFTNPWITTIGGMCYSIYLLHNYLTSAFCWATRGIAPFGAPWLNFALQILLVFPPVLAICAVYFLLVEKPCMRRDWPQRAMARLRRAWGTSG